MGDHITAAFSTLAAVSGASAQRQAARARGRVAQAHPLDAGPADRIETLFRHRRRPLVRPLCARQDAGPIVAQLAAWFGSAVSAPELQDKLAVQGLLPAAMCGPEFGSYVRAQYEKYGRGIRDANIKAE